MFCFLLVYYCVLIMSSLKAGILSSVFLLGLANEELQEINTREEIEAIQGICSCVFSFARLLCNWLHPSTEVTAHAR